MFYSRQKIRCPDKLKNDDEFILEFKLIRIDICEPKYIYHECFFPNRSFVPMGTSKKKFLKIEHYGISNHVHHLCLLLRYINIIVTVWK